MTGRTLVLLLGALALAVVIGCGSDNKTASSNPQPTPLPMPQPSPQPSPTPSPTTPTPNPPQAVTAQYEAVLLRPGATGSTAAGQIIVNAGGSSGAGQVTATGGAANATYSISFKPFTNSNSVINLGTVNSDASGNLNGTFTFSQQGTFAGVFHLSAGTNAFATEVDPMDSGVDDNGAMIFNAPLVRASTVSPAISSGVTIGTDALGSGVVTAGNGKLHAALQGAAPNTMYSIVECGVNAGSSCQAINQPGTVTTNASGNATLDQNFFTNGDPAVVFEFFSNNQLQFVSGFTVK